MKREIDELVRLAFVNVENVSLRIFLQQISLDGSRWRMMVRRINRRKARYGRYTLERVKDAVRML